MIRPMVTIGRDGDAVVLAVPLVQDDRQTTARQQRSAIASRDGNAFVESTVLIEGDAAGKVRAFDGVRADGWFSFEKSDSTAYCTDSFFRQTIGFKVP